MNDMRLPGLGWLNNEPAPSREGSADAGRDPAQAFDAVMSRFSNERASAPPPETQNGAPAKTASNTARPQGKAPAQPNGRTEPKGQPVARAKEKDNGEEPVDPLTPDANIDPASVVAALAESTQLAAQNPEAVQAQSTDAAPAAAKDARVEPAISAAALDALAARFFAAPARDGKKEPAETQPPSASEDDVVPVTTGAPPNKRTPLAAKDTLRIEAPLARSLDAAKADFAQRLNATTTAFTQATTAPSHSMPGGDNAAQTIAAAVAQANGSTATYSVAHSAVGARVGSAGFADELSQRVVVFAGQKVQRAEIAVTPADLGPIAVSIEVRGQEATLAFAAANHMTRTAIEDALPRLREMLSAQGLQLAGTHVGSEPRRDPYRPARNEQNSSSGIAASEGVTTISAPTNGEIRRGLNLIDIEV
jgi:flagellar hook-length control protein FliK